MEKLGVFLCTGCGIGEAIDVDGVIASWDWDFGDGDTASGVTANHAYTSFGTYTATLTVADDDVPAKLGWTTTQVTVDLGNTPPTADADGPYAATNGEALTLDGSGSTDPDEPCGDTVVSFEWSIGGGALASTEVAPTFDWQDLEAQLGPGQHDVLLTVTDSFGETASDLTTVTVP